MPLTLILKSTIQRTKQSQSNKEKDDDNASLFSTLKIDKEKNK